MNGTCISSLFGMGLAAAVLLACPAMTQASPLIAAATPVAGVSQHELARQYSAWLFTETTTTPFDQALLNTTNPGLVTFLPAAFVPTATYNLTIEAGLPVFFPVLVWQAWFDVDQSTDSPPCNAVPAANRFTCNQADLATYANNPSSLTLIVDGLVISVPDSQRLDSGGVPFDVTFGADSAYVTYGVVPGIPYYALFDGWWAALSPLSPGQHVVQYGFDYSGNGVMTTANISVVPVSPTTPLVALGLLVLAIQRRLQMDRN